MNYTVTILLDVFGGIFGVIGYALIAFFYLITENIEGISSGDIALYAALFAGIAGILKTLPAIITALKGEKKLIEDLQREVEELKSKVN